MEPITVRPRETKNRDGYALAVFQVGDGTYITVEGEGATKVALDLAQAYEYVRLIREAIPK